MNSPTPPPQPNADGKPWNGADWRDPEADPTWELTPAEHDEFGEWRRQSKEYDGWERAQWEAPPEEVAADDVDQAAYVASQIGYVPESYGGDGLKAPLTRPEVTFTDAAGRPVDRIVDDQEFRVEVQIPVIDGAAPPPEIRVQIGALDQGTEPLTLRLNASVHGVATYNSEAITTKSGGGRVVEAGPLEFSLPQPFGIDPIDIRDGDTLSATYEGSSGSTTVFTSSVKLQLDAISQAIGHAYQGHVTLLINLRGLEAQLGQVTDPVQLQMLKDWIAATRTDAEIRLGIASRARQWMNNTEVADHKRLAGARQYAAMLGVTQTPFTYSDGGAPVSTGDVLSNWSRVAENEAIFRAQEGASEDMERVMWSGLKNATIGGYRLLANATGMAQIVTIGGYFTGTGNEMGEHVTGVDAFLAFTDLVVQASMMGASIKFSLDHAHSATTPRLERPAPVQRTRDPSIEKPLKGAAAGEIVRDTGAIGMTGAQANRMNGVLDRMSLEWGRPVRSVQRAASPGGVSRIEAGSAGKPEPLKAKGVNETDVRGGWADPTTTETTGYFTPKQLGDALGVDPATLATRVPDPNNPGQMTWKAGERPAHIDGAVWDRAVQRFREFHDEGPMINQLVDRGLIRIEGNGQIIDTGVTNFRLDPDTHELYRGWNGPPAGTGRPMAPDPDPFEYQWRNPETGRWERLPDAQEAQLTDALHEAGVMHGPVAHWNPHEPKNLSIKDNILRGHTGQVGPDGTIVAAPSAEALVIFGGRFRPRVTAYADGTQVTAGDLPILRAGPDGTAAHLPGIPYVDLRGTWWMAHPHELLDGTAPSTGEWSWTQQYDWNQHFDAFQADSITLTQQFLLPPPPPPSSSGPALTSEVFDPLADGGRGRWVKRVLVGAGATVVIGGLLLGGSSLFGGDGDEVTSGTARSAAAVRTTTTSASSIAADETTTTLAVTTGAEPASAVAEGTVAADPSVVPATTTTTARTAPGSTAPRANAAAPAVTTTTGAVAAPAPTPPPTSPTTQPSGQPATTTTTTPPTTTTAAPTGGQKTVTFSGVNCPADGGSITHFFDVFIPTDASNPTHQFLSTGGAPITEICPGLSQTVTTSGDGSPPPGSKSYRARVEITNPAGGPAGGGTTSFQMQVTWS